MRVNVVRFAPCACTAWHSHPVGQMLHVTEGRGLIQSRGGEVLEIRPGYTNLDAARRVALARRRTRPLHVALGDVGGARTDTVPESAWGDLLTDEEYRKH